MRRVNIQRTGTMAVIAFGAALLTACADPETGVTWFSPVEVDSGEAYRGPWRMNESQFHFVDDPTIALTDNGTVAVVWGDLAQRDILFQAYDRDGTARHDQPTNISRSPNVFSWLPRIVASSPDAAQIFVLWQEIVFSGGSHGGEIFFARSTDGGASFSEPINLSNTIAGAGKGRLTRDHWHNGSLDLALGHDGMLYAAWTEYEGALWFSRSDDGGVTFSQPLHVAGDDALPARGPALAVTGDHTIHLAWTVGEDRRADIRLSRSRDQGLTFDESRLVHAGPGHADAPKLAVDGNSTLHLAYGESATGPFRHYAVKYARADNGTDFEEPRTLSGRHGASFPSLSVDNNGRVHVIWEEFPPETFRSRGLGYAVSRNNGTSFSSPAVIPGTGNPALGFNGSQQGLLMRKLAVNDDGDIAVVNSTFNPGESSHIWLIRGTHTRIAD